MKIRTIKYIFSVLMIIFALTSCDKEELIVSEPNTVSQQSILSFKTTEEFNTTLAKVTAMTKTERLAWEEEQGFKSLGTICDEFYETINPMDFKSINEVKIFVAKNSDKVEFYTSSDGETYCVSKGFNNAERYLMNKEGAYIISSVVIKNDDSKQIAENNTSNTFGIQKAPAAFVTSYEIIDNNVIGNDTYRMHIWIDTYNYFDSFEGMTFLKNELKLSNFARWLAIWWERTYSTEYRITLQTSDIAYGLLTFGNGAHTITEGIKSKYIINVNLPVAGGPGVNSQPHLVYHNIYAKNSKGCVIDETKTY